MKTFATLTFSFALIFLLGNVSSIEAQSNRIDKKVFLVWEANTIVPSFYEAKPLLSPRAQSVVTAIVDNPNPESLTYVWLFNGQVQPDKSGVGVSQFFNDTSGQENTITVVVKSGSQEIGRASIEIPVSNLEQAIYRYNQLYGYEFGRRLTDTIQSSNQTLELSSYTYFKKTTQLPQWFINNSLVPSENNRISVSSEAGDRVRVETRYDGGYRQSAGSILTVLFPIAN